MKLVVVFAVFVAAIAAAPTDKEATIIAEQNIPNTGDGSFQNGFETSNGISAEAQGTLKNVGTENEATSVVGRFKFLIDGIEYLVTYVADENGYRPSAPFLPK